MINLEECLPAELRGAGATITPISAGLSGAGVFRVEASGLTLVLKVSRDAEPLAEWQRKVRIHSAAAHAGLAPRIVHIDENRRAVVSEFVVDRSFPALFMTPATRDAAIALLGSTLRRVHELPAPADAPPDDGRVLLAETRTRLIAESAVPGWALEAITDALKAEPPPRDRPPVRSHNDVNPSNLAYDGERLLLVDWDVAGVNDPTYDLASIALFLRMDEETCMKLLAVHDGAPVNALPPRFLYNRRLVGAMCGALFLDMARRGGHPAATPEEETFESALSLIDVYQQMRAGRVSPATPDGQWVFGLALLKASITRLQGAPERAS